MWGVGKRAGRPVNKQLQELMSDNDELWDDNNMLGDEVELDFWKRDGQILSLWGGGSRTGASMMRSLTPGGIHSKGTAKQVFLARTDVEWLLEPTHTSFSQAVATALKQSCGCFHQDSGVRPWSCWVI